MLGVGFFFSLLHEYLMVFALLRKKKKVRQQLSFFVVKLEMFVTGLRVGV